MTLLPKLDEKQTKKNAREVLKNCRRLQRLAGVSLTSNLSMLQSPNLSDMPRNHSNINAIEYKMIKSIGLTRKYDSQQVLIEIKKALDLLPEVSRKILHYSYCIENPYSIVKISRKIAVYRESEFGDPEIAYYSPKTIEYLKGIALIEFAEAYKGEDLLAYEN